MAMIHVNRSGQNLGVFDEARVREGLASGEFIGTDLAWREGMTTWQPLSEFESFGGAATPPQTPPPTTPAPTAMPTDIPMPGATPGSTPGGMPGPTHASASLAPAGAVQSEGEGTGLPWENRDQHGFANGLLKTIVMVLTRPHEAYGVMKRDAGLMDPLLYAIIIGTAASLVAFVYSMIFQSIGMVGAGDGALGRFLGAGAMSFLSVIFAPVIIAVVLFIAAGIAHLCLMLVGGANRSFETTLRVLCYSSGSANVLQLVPGCGGVLAGIASIVLNCIGLARAHQTDTWRAVVAVLLPLVVCCGVGAMLFFLIFGAAAMAAGSR
jgi:hypothetical protein